MTLSLQRWSFVEIAGRAVSVHIRYQRYLDPRLMLPVQKVNGISTQGQEVVQCMLLACVVNESLTALSSNNETLAARQQAGC
jgi:hypothetical protein